MSTYIENLQESHAHGLTVGVVPENGVLRTRLEIDELIKRKEMFNLYLLALIDLQKYDSWKERFSYFQIAGIHGKPYVPWDGVRPSSGTVISEDLERDREGNPLHQTNPAAGYCSHGSNLFPTWHRAYLAMLEQAVFLEMIKIAKNFPEPHRKLYMDAAMQFGLPYWDPFLPRRRVINQYGYPIYKCGIPIIMMIPRVFIRAPKQPEVLTEVANPLYAYNFDLNRAEWEKDLEFSWEDMFRDVLQSPTMAFQTIRGLSPAGTTDHKFVNNTLTNAASQENGPAVPLGGKLYRLLNGPPLTYTQMSNSAYISQGAGEKERPLNKENSLEGFHNDIHNLCGTGEGGRLGHMGLNEFAAFDPIFFLHHANIDRLCAIWQAMNDSDQVWDWHQPLLERASYVTPIGTEETPHTPLIPFRKAYTSFTYHEEVHTEDTVHREATHPPLETHHSDLQLLHHKGAPHKKDHHKRDNHHNTPTTQNSLQPQYIDRTEWQTIYWTSNDLRRISALGYTYPELISTHSDPRLLRQWVIEQYEWTTIAGSPPPYSSIFSTEDLSHVEAFPSILQIDGRGPPIEIPEEKLIYGREFLSSAGTIPRILGKCFGRSSGSGSSSSGECTPMQNRYAHLKGLVKNERMTQWNLTIKVQKFALSGSFTIFIFLGPVPPFPSLWHHSCYLAGIDGIFATRATNTPHCPNCRAQDAAGLIDSDVIPLTTPLVSAWRSREKCELEVGDGKRRKLRRLKSLDVEHVLPWLKVNLRWRVLDAQGTLHDPRAIPGLEFDVGSQVVRLPYGVGKAPEYGVEVIHRGVTDGR